MAMRFPQNLARPKQPLIGSRSLTIHDSPVKFMKNAEPRKYSKEQCAWLKSHGIPLPDGTAETDAVIEAKKLPLLLMGIQLPGTPFDWMIEIAEAEVMAAIDAKFQPKSEPQKQPPPAAPLGLSPHGNN